MCVQQYWKTKTIRMAFPGKFSVLFLVLQWLVFSGNLHVQACMFYVSNKCSFPIWPATAPNQGHPVLANGGFHLPPGKTQRILAPGDWTGRIWARTGCNFDSTTNHKLGCETGDCGRKLECNGLIGTPPATLVEFTLQIDKHKPNFYDVSVVDGYNLPVQVSATSTRPNKKCLIRGCKQNLKDTCPEEIKVRNDKGEVVACKSACLAFDNDSFCCRNEHASPKTCKPSMYSRVFKEACPNYVSYAFDTPTPLVSCGSDEYVITFCPRHWGMEYSSD